VRILVATGERHIARLIQVNLERQGCDVLISFEGTECMMTAIKENLDLIVLDKRLPPIGGLTVFNALQENELTKHTDLMVLGEREDDWPEAGPRGPKMYLRKPNDIFKLFAMVEAQ